MSRERRRHSRVLTALLLALALMASACSGDDDTEAGAEDGAATETSADDSADESAADESAADDSAADDSADDSAADDAAPEEDTAEDTAEDTEVPEGALAVGLGEWFVEVPDGITAGTLTFAVENTGENPHAFAIVRGDAYEDLPQKDNGAVDIDAVGDDFLGNTDNLETGESTTIDFDLEAGNYVFFCPIEFGPNSHAAAGQVLSVTVG